MKKNTGKAPSIQLYFKDFMAEMLEYDPDIVGAWFLVMLKIWDLNDGGSVNKTLSQFAKIMHTDQIGAKRFIDYFRDEKIADVTEDNGRITIVNRRAKRDSKLREANRLRQKRFRDNAQSNADVAPEKVNPSSSSSSSSSVSTTIKEKERSDFDEFRKLYPGKKRGLDPEFGNFKKYKNWRDILPLLKAAVQNQIAVRAKVKQGEWQASWKNLQTWINNQCWTEEGEQNSDGRDCVDCHAPYAEGHKYQIIEGVKVWRCPTCRGAA
ncbi:hypothetical protein LCGC14_1788010 [marine sediment metagenome]|uniref:Bacteriophage lambda Replication protein O N-terminal domain-containing protein n=1 Tax=marine sediment metagenome TaxID=412755 RepID=A0A0F9GTF8_9ZZZZ